MVVFSSGESKRNYWAYPRLWHNSRWVHQCKGKNLVLRKCSSWKWDRESSHNTFFDCTFLLVGSRYKSNANWWIKCESWTGQPEQDIWSSVFQVISWKPMFITVWRLLIFVYVAFFADGLVMSHENQNSTSLILLFPYMHYLNKLCARYVS